MARQQAGRSPADIEEVIHEASRLLVEAAHPEKIILFGSYARGDFTEDSDLDFLVIVSAVEDTFEEMMRLERVLLSLPVPVDVLVYSTDDVRDRGHLRGTVLYHALTEGQILHDAA
jgi:predicted nucleotidyltransferase